jgi:hypothetical protein
MTKYILTISRMFAFVPFMAIPSTALIANIGSLNTAPVTSVVETVDELRQQKADAIDTYFRSASCAR